MELLQDADMLCSLTPEKAQDYLGLKLAFLSCKVFSPLKGSVCAFFDCGAPDTIAFPGAITPENGMYLATLLSLAQRSKGKTLPRNLLFVFFPQGSGKDICQTGIFRQYRVNKILGLNLRDGETPGTFSGRKNEMLSRSCEITGTVQGENALDCAVTFYNRVAALDQTIPEDVFRLIKFTRLAGTDTAAKFHFMLRTFQDELYNDLRASVTAIARELNDTGCTVSLTMEDGYPAVLNSPELFDKVKKLIPIRELKAPEMDTDEFSVFQRHGEALLLFFSPSRETLITAADALEKILRSL